MRKAVFIDRDGIINNDEGHYYIYKPEDFKLNNGVVEGLKLLQENGYLLIVVTNQGGVAKGIYTEEDIQEVHNEMERQLADSGVYLDAVAYCPHHESVKKCSCRKPSPYMINKAIEDFDLDKSKCFMIGDSDRDIESARAAGIKGYKISKNSSIVEVCKLIVSHED